jgi:hypothetical protein
MSNILDYLSVVSQLYHEGVALACLAVPAFDILILIVSCAIYDI